MPATVGEIVNFHGVVPPACVNAVEESARPAVVVSFDPPPMVSGLFTKIVVALTPIAPTESVATTVS